MSTGARPSLADRALKVEAGQARQEARNFGLELAIGLSTFSNERILLDVGQNPNYQEPQRSQQHTDQRAEDKRPPQRPEYVAQHQGVSDERVKSIRAQRGVPVGVGESRNPQTQVRA